ncbi:MAG: hypothetical protein EPGJADBJ_01448 [Saprospiraceae bacterium]|nr:hypothetical protein [Saprospiraceae bacterium]
MASLSPLQGSLGKRRAAHLLRRTSYRFTKAKVDQMAGQSAAEALDSLLTLYPLQLDQPVYSNDNAVPPVAWINPPGTPLPAGTQDFMMRPYLRGWWINEALHDPGIGHKMAFFFHQYLITSIVGTGLTASYFDYLALLRWGALGNFKKLATKLVTDNSMLRYLNNNENTFTNPNENFAREYFELFTIGKGPQIGPGDYTNYTEDDIVAAARVLTGFRARGQRDTIDPETGIPMGRAIFNQHDPGSKAFSDKFQNTVIAGASNAAGMFTELNAFVDMIFAQPETAKNLCRRLYHYFVYRKITDEIENDIIVPLSNTLIANDFEIKPVLAQLLASEHFYDADDSNIADEFIGGMIKSPLELALQSISFFDIAIPDPMTQPRTHYRFFYEQAVTTRMFGAANLPIFMPSDVAGYPGLYADPDFSRQWFNSSTIIARYKVPAMLLTGTRQFGGTPNLSIGVKLDIAPWVKNSGFFSDPSDPYVLVQELLEYLLPEQVDTDRFNYFYILVFLDQLPPADWTYEWQNYLTTGNDAEVKIALERLVNAVMYSPEYQTF